MPSSGEDRPYDLSGRVERNPREPEHAASQLMRSSFGVHFCQVLPGASCAQTQCFFQPLANGICCPIFPVYGDQRFIYRKPRGLETGAPESALLTQRLRLDCRFFEIGFVRTLGYSLWGNGVQAM